ncbi:hypothetical protein HAPAU_12080 [Halalkalicoccus paucihalophilus]|uniref:Uncharacterized protein n=1 Tax=Halalkalicoccus paucihalophilus TaxID=1008153 RepID=A0A151AEM1_9EURY|nr:hypothetical protein [Halalkalicoccus paucihalophilus]KYH26116.1 hypothetical protein HAPAU_12080 [Halalkalicoccus paucihalophilus]
MIVVATEDFEVYHGVVGELRERGVAFTTIEPGDELPERTRVLIGGPDDEPPDGVESIRADPDNPREAVEAALSALRTGDGRTIIGVDPGDRPGIAVLSGETVVAAFQVPLADAAELVIEEVRGGLDPLVRIGDGARLQGATIVNALDGVRVELVDETGTTPSLGTGARGMGDVLAAVNIARMEGEAIEHREIEPTEGELTVIKRRSRERSPENREIDEALARRVAHGELTVEEALEKHREE